MEKDRAARQRYAEAVGALNDQLIFLGTEGAVLPHLYLDIAKALAERLDELAERLDDHDAYLREQGAGENTIDWAALEEAWTPEDEATPHAEMPPTLPHQP